jgi:hypothetical protein
MYAHAAPSGMLKFEGSGLAPPGGLPPAGSGLAGPQTSGGSVRGHSMSGNRWALACLGCLGSGFCTGAQAVVSGPRARHHGHAVVSRPGLPAAPLASLAAHPPLACQLAPTPGPPALLRSAG